MKKTIILGITASIAAYKACELISHLRKKGYEVICIMTKESVEFITPLTLETLSGNKVYKDMFALPGNRGSVHVSLADKADLIVVCPATANIIGKLASGVCDDLLTCTVFSSKKPILIAPAMHNNMYKHKITQENISKLKKTGCAFIGPISGHLACGYVGMGHLAPISEILKKIEKTLK